MVRSLWIFASVLIVAASARCLFGDEPAQRTTKADIDSDASLFNVYFVNNFQDDTPGEYLDREWDFDWYGRYGLGDPGWSCRQIAPRIELDSDDRTNKVMRWTFPKGSVGPSKGGGQWESRFEKAFKDIYFGYRIKFMPDFQWNRGGKIPGLGIEYNRPNRPRALTASLMFKERGNLEFYTYNLDQAGHFGDSLPWDYRMPTGKWIHIAIHAKMNDVGKSNGLVEGFIDGRLVTRHTGLRYLNSMNADSGVDCIKAYTFFGASPRWASPIDQWLEVDDFVLFDFKSGVEPLDAKGNLCIPKAIAIATPVARGKWMVPKESSGGEISPRTMKRDPAAYGP